jgi:hypothetical protein
MRIFGPHHCYTLIGFDDEFEIGDILSTKPEISGLGIHAFTVFSSELGVRS